MTEAQRAAIAAIESQQPQKHNTVWMAGEQLKEIARSEPGSAELLAKDPGGQGHDDRGRGEEDRGSWRGRTKTATADA